MARQQQDQANTLFNESQGLNKSATTNANSLYSQLFPTYAAEAEGKPTAGTIAENTALQQGVGGAEAGALGLGQLEAARTGNAGANTVAMDDAVRHGGNTLSTEASKIKADEVAGGQRGLASLYGSSVGQEGQSLGLGNEAVNTGIDAGKSGWFQNMLSGIKAGTDVFKALYPGGVGGGGAGSGSGG
jgi:hypothetical protein